jgi:hypothetical protein
LVSEAERKRLKQELDALSISHDALTIRCAQLEQLLDGQADSSSTNSSSRDHSASSATAAMSNEQLEVMHQQLAEADRFLNQQQQQQQALYASDSKACGLLRMAVQLSVASKENKVSLAAAEARASAAEAQCAASQQQLAGLRQQNRRLQADVKTSQRQLQTILDQTDSIARWKAEQQQHKEKLAAAEAATRRAQLNESAMLQAMAHLSNQLEASRKDTSRARGQVAKGRKQVAAVTAENEALHNKAANAQLAQAATAGQLADAQRRNHELRAWFRQKWVDIKPALDQMKEEEQQAAAIKGQLLVQVAQLRRQLQLTGADSSSDLLQPAAIPRVRSKDVPVHPIDVSSEGKGCRLRWMWGWAVKR